MQGGSCPQNDDSPRIPLPALLSRANGVPPTRKVDWPPLFAYTPFRVVHDGINFNLDEVCGIY